MTRRNPSKKRWSRPFPFLTLGANRRMPVELDGLKLVAPYTRCESSAYGRTGLARCLRSLGAVAKKRVAVRGDEP